MYKAAKAVSKVNRRFVAWRPVRAQDPEPDSPPQQQQEHMEEDYPAGGSGSQQQSEPGWVQTLMGNFGSMQLRDDDRWEQIQQRQRIEDERWEQIQQQQQINDQRWQNFDQFGNEVRYELGSLHYKEDYQTHNQQRLFQNPPPEYPTPYHPPPRWGEPGGHLPAPVYDRDAAWVELQMHQEFLRTSTFHDQQQQWGTDSAAPNQGQGSSQPRDTSADWLFPPHDPAED